jgi:hypothetical protein
MVKMKKHPRQYHVFTYFYTVVKHFEPRDPKKAGSATINADLQEAGA